MNIYIASPQKFWILDSGASFYMTSMKQKSDSLNLSNKFSSVNIADGTESPVLGNVVVRVLHPWLLLMSYMFQIFLLAYYLSVSLPSNIIAK